MIDAAIYGLGQWGQALVRSVQGNSGKIRFVAGVTRNAAAHGDFVKETGLALQEDYAAVLSDPAVDAVVLATPHSRHAEQVRQAAAAGKHVMVEKPFTLSKASALEAESACRRAGKVLAVGFNRRFLPAFQEMKSIIAAGGIGNILHLEAQFSGPSGYRRPPGTWRSERAENPAGGMTPRGIHVLDMMIHLCGEVESAFARSDRREVRIDTDDTTSALFRFRSGITGYLSTLMATGEFLRLHAFGSQGWLEMRGENSLTLSDLDRVVWTKEFEPAQTLKAELEAFADAVSGGAPFPVAPAEAIHGIAVLEAILKSATSGVEVPVD